MKPLDFKIIFDIRSDSFDRVIRCGIYIRPTLIGGVYDNIPPPYLIASYVKGVIDGTNKIT